MYYILSNERFINLMINILGVLIGGLLAFWIARWQIARQSKDSDEKDNELLNIHINRIKIELRDNRNIISQLISTLDQVSESRNDIWEWAISIVESFSYNAYRDFLGTSLNRKLSVHLETNISSAYNDLESLMHMVKKSYQGHKFYYGYSGDSKSANLLLSNVKTYSRTVLHSISKTVDEVYKYHSDLENNKKHKYFA